MYRLRVDSPQQRAVYPICPAVRLALKTSSLCSSDYQTFPISTVEQAEQGRGQCISLPALGSLNIL